MLGQFILDKDGLPIDSGAKKLSPSKYVPPSEVLKLFARVQTDFQHAYSLKHRPLDEFDGYSLMQRARLDQETFAAHVGITYSPQQRRWRWKGRKNTSRNKLISILAHMIAGMLYPYVHAQNERDEEDKVTAQMMRILVEQRLQDAQYDVKFFYIVLTALVNPIVPIEVEMVEELTTIRERMANGEMNIRQVIDEAMSGLFLHIVPLDEIYFGDFWTGTGDVQAQPFIIRERRIPYESARGKYSGRYFLDGVDLFDYVEAGRTKLFYSSFGDQLFDVDVQELDTNFVQEITIRYRKDDLEFTWVGGVGMFDHAHPYNNPMKHRRMTLTKKTGWAQVPMYPFALGGFEPIDPTGRFLFFKSGAFKEYWEDKKLTEIDRMLVDGIKLEVMKPIFLAGIAKIDSDVLAPGAVTSMPEKASVTPYSLGPNLVQAYNMIIQAEKDMSMSTQDKIMEGVTEKGITATQTNQASVNARIFLGVFGFMMATLVRQIGELVMDCIIMYDTVGEVDELSDGDFKLKYRTILAKGKDRGKNITNRIVFTDQFMGRKYTEEQIRQIEWDLFNKSGGAESDQRIWMANPYKFARTRYSMFIDADQIVAKSSGLDRIEKERAFEKLMDPRVMPFIDAENVVSDFVIDEYSDGDPERYKRKGGSTELMNAMLGQAAQGGTTPQPTAPQQLMPTA